MLLKELQLLASCFFRTEYSADESSHLVLQVAFLRLTPSLIDPVEYNSIAIRNPMDAAGLQALVHQLFSTDEHAVHLALDQYVSQN